MSSVFIFSSNFMLKMLHMGVVLYSYCCIVSVICKLPPSCISEKTVAVRTALYRFKFDLCYSHLNTFVIFYFFLILIYNTDLRLSGKLLPSYPSSFMTLSTLSLMLTRKLTLN